MWGQGLRDDEKLKPLLQATYSLPPSAVHNFAHSGAVIGSIDELGETGKYTGEVPDGYPTIRAQVRRNAEEFSKSADTIVVNGCANDVGLDAIVDPDFFRQEDKFHKNLDELCEKRMHELLEDILRLYVNGGAVRRVLILGYFPILSRESTRDTNAWNLTLLKTYRSGYTWRAADIARLIADAKSRGKHGLIGANALDCGAIGLPCLVKEHAILFYGWANEELKAAVTSMNDPRFVFVQPKFEDKDAAYAGWSPADTSVWEVKMSSAGWPPWVGRAEPEDDAIAERTEVCKGIKGKSDQNTCVIASLGHPNRCGEVRYADAIIDELNRRGPTKATPIPISTPCSSATAEPTTPIDTSSGR